MSLRFVSSLNSPPFVAAAGVAVIAGLPFVEAAAASGASLALLKGLNLAAFAGNCAAVSVPGRIDEQQDVAMRKGALDPSKPGAPTEHESQRCHDRWRRIHGNIFSVPRTIPRLAIGLGVCNMGTDLSRRGCLCGRTVLFRCSCRRPASGGSSIHRCQYHAIVVVCKLPPKLQ